MIAALLPQSSCRPLSCVKKLSCVLLVSTTIAPLEAIASQLHSQLLSWPCCSYKHMHSPGYCDPHVAATYGIASHFPMGYGRVNTSSVVTKLRVDASAVQVRIARESAIAIKAAYLPADWKAVRKSGMFVQQ